MNLRQHGGNGDVRLLQCGAAAFRSVYKTHTLLQPGPFRNIGKYLHRYLA